MNNVYLIIEQNLFHLRIFVMLSVVSKPFSMFIDIHTHKNSSLQKYPAIQNLTFSEAEKIFNSDQQGFFSVGFHPWFANEFSGELMKDLANWATDERFILIGECGLDKNSKVPFEVQSNVFEQQIILSETIKKPLIIHCVGSFNEILEFRKKTKPVQLWIIHGFRGKPELANQLLKAGCALSYGEYFNANSVQITPIEKLFIETDESILQIDVIYNQIAEIKHITTDALTERYFLVENLKIKI